MRARVAFLCSLAVVLALPREVAGAPSTFPFERDGTTEFWLLTSSAAVGAVGLLAARSQAPLDSTRLARLDTEALWALDRAVPAGAPKSGSGHARPASPPIMAWTIRF